MSSRFSGAHWKSYSRAMDLTAFWKAAWLATPSTRSPSMYTARPSSRLST